MSGDISLLNFDGTFHIQNQLKTRAGEWIDMSDLQGCHGYCEQQTLHRIKTRLQSRKYRGVTFIGSGNYHYVTYVLLSEIRQPFSLILFDYHTDLSPREDAAVLSCGSWVTHALYTLPLLKHVVIVGADPGNHVSMEFANGHPVTAEPVAPDAADMKPACPKPVTLISESDVKRLSTAALLRKIRASLPDLPVYISVDKDVLSEKDAATNWDQGSMTLQQLLTLIRRLKQDYTVIAADVCGELPLSPLDHFAADRVRLAKKNETANRAIADILTAS